MNIIDTVEQIEIIAGMTGVNLDEVTRPAYEISAISRKLRTVTSGSIDRAQQIAISAVRGTAEDFDQKWEEAFTEGIAATIGAELYEKATDALIKREESAAKKMGWAAMGLLSKHVDKLGRELAKLDIANISTAEKAIAAGSTDDYTRANDLIDQLHEIAALPDLGRNSLPLWVIIEPPVLPAARADEDTLKYRLQLASDHTPDELRLINQAVDIRKASTFRDQVLAALRHGWKINAATSDDDYRERNTAHHAASHISGANVTATID